MRSFSDFPTLLFPEPSSCHRSNRRRSRVLLDKAWAKQLDVHRSSGSYRLDRRELGARLHRHGVGEMLAREWEIDPAYTNVGFFAKYLMLSNVRGEFREVAGTLRLGDLPEESSVEITVHASSIDTGLSVRDEHLRSEDFLDVDNHPVLRFRSTWVKRVRDNVFDMRGDLTIKGITRPVALEVCYLGAARDPNGKLKAAFEARGSIDREEFGLTWNQRLKSGGFLLDRHVNLQIEAQATPKLAA
jgi:polyisoprenoid-binding protein YceI